MRGWTSDLKTKQRAKTLLRTRYPRGSWTAKLNSARDGN